MGISSNNLELNQHPTIIPFNHRAVLDQSIEHKTTFSLNNCELSIFETHSAAYDVNMRFNDLTFTTMLSGKKSLKFMNKGNYFDYLPGESVLVAPGETLSIDFPDADKESAQCIALAIDQNFINHTLEQLNLHQSKEDDMNWSIHKDFYFLINNSALVAAAQNILRVALDNNTQKDLFAELALKELLVRLMQTQGRQLIERSLPNSNNHSTLSFITNHINQNLHQKINFDALAKLAYISKSKMFKLFKQELGITPNDYIIQLRVEKAKKLLRSNYSIKEIAYEIGFSDSNYFIKIFKSLVGVTPKHYQLNLI
jgi:YesN/AraC family two-component response regulator